MVRTKRILALELSLAQLASHRDEIKARGNVEQAAALNYTWQMLDNLRKDLLCNCSDSELCALEVARAART